MKVSREEQAYRWSALVLGLVLVVVMLTTFRDYGVTGDEGFQHRYGRRLERWYATFGADRSAVEQHDTYYYGGFFELVAEGATRILPYGVYESRHLANALVSLLAFGAAWMMGSHLAGPRGGFLSLAFLVLTPPFYGHAFANPKDIPFAALFALTLAMALRTGATGPPSVRDVALTGVVLGLTAGVRVAGLTLVVFVAVLWIGRLWLSRAVPPADRQLEGRESWSARSVAASLLIVVGIGWVVMVAFWPWAQLDPLRNPFRAFQVFSRFWEHMVVLYDGRLVTSGEVSRFYAPRYLSLTLPETYAVAAVVGLAALAAALRSGLSDRDRRLRVFEAVWLLSVAVLTVAWLVVRGVPLYNGVRHVLFVVPVLAVLSGVSLAVALGGRLPRPIALGAVAIAGGLALVTLVDMVRLHPYQSLYFNRWVAGGLPGAVGQWETDYWCSSYKEGVEWIVARHATDPPGERIRIAGHSGVFQITAGLRTPELERRFKGVTIHEDPNYILATTATGDHERTPGRPVHVIERMGAPIAYVFEARPVPDVRP